MAKATQQLIGESPAFHALMDKVSDAAVLDRPLLVMGERGTGKELIASRLHFLSPRWEQVFVQVNCAAYTDPLLDAALFGEIFPDGRTDIEGQFARAEGGTLFLDNIDAMSSRLQEKLLQTFEYGLIDPLGSPETQDVNVRVIAASTQNLPQAVSDGTFRADLLEHLSFDVVHLPPLRTRHEDIIPLAQYFGRKIATRLGAESFPSFTPEAVAQLQNHHWHGNVRELKAVIERSTGQAWLTNEALDTPLSDVIFNPFHTPWEQTATPTPTETVDATQPAEDTPIDTTDFQERLRLFERGLIDEALLTQKNHQGKAADYLGLTYHQFRGLLRKHGLKK